MPPLNINPNPIKPLQTPPTIDPQTKRIMMFVVIFTVLSSIVVVFLLFKPENRSSGAKASPAATSTEIEVQKKESFLSKLLNFGKAPSVQNKTVATSTKPARPTRTTRATTTLAKRSTATTTRTRTTSSRTPVSTTSVPYKQLEGIYSERPSAEDQVGLEFFQKDLPSSPYRGQIYISSVRRSTSVGKEYIVISTKSGLPENTDISGFTLKSVVSGQIVQIGKGVYLPFLNQINSSEPIRISTGQKIHVISGPSPLGYSFRINKCTGYFEQYQDFTPALPRSCPLVKNEPRPAPPNQLSDECIAKLSRISTCTIPSSYEATGDNDQKNDCVQFIQNNVGYTNCVNIHRSDSDFHGKVWWAYLNHSTPIWKATREIIWLLDREGKFISQYSY